MPYRFIRWELNEPGKIGKPLGGSKINKEEAIASFLQGVPTTEIADRYGVSISAVLHCVRRNAKACGEEPPGA